MLFQKRVDRAMKYSKDKMQKYKLGMTVNNGEQEFLSEALEKGDLPALIISALLVFLPVAMAVVLFMCFIGILPTLF